MERHNESAYRCSRVGHAACQPDFRSDRQQSDLWRLRLGTKLPLLRFQSITPLGRGLWFKPTRWLDYAAGPVPAAWSKILARWEGKMFGKVRVMAIAAATLLASPAFGDWRSDQTAQVDHSRIVSEIVVNGRPTPVDSYQASANELQPVPSFALPDETNSVY